MHIATSALNVTEHVDTFDIDSNGRSANDPAYDLAGNLTFDGVRAVAGQASTSSVSKVSRMRSPAARVAELAPGCGIAAAEKLAWSRARC